MRQLKRIGSAVWRISKTAIIVAAIVFAIQGNPWVQRSEFRALAQLCSWTPGSTLTGSPLCTFVGQVFLAGIQVGSTGMPLSVICVVSGTTNGASEVDVTPTCALPTSTTPGTRQAEVFCTPASGPGPSLVGWIKNATQLGVSPSAAPGTNVTFECLVIGH